MCNSNVGSIADSLFMPSKSADASIWASASSVGTRWYAALSSVVMLPMHILSFKS